MAEAVAVEVPGGGHVVAALVVAGDGGRRREGQHEHRGEYYWRKLLPHFIFSSLDFGFGTLGLANGKQETTRN